MRGKNTKPLHYYSIKKNANKSQPTGSLQSLNEVLNFGTVMESIFDILWYIEFQFF